MTWEPSRKSVEAAVDALMELPCDAGFPTKARAALIAAHKAEGDGWQPIETAPKDGTRILVSYRLGVTIVRQQNATDWYEEEDTPHFVEWECDDNYYSSYLTSEDYPTHWRPLPPLPREDSK